MRLYLELDLLSERDIADDKWSGFRMISIEPQIARMWLTPARWLSCRVALSFRTGLGGRVPRDSKAKRTNVCNLFHVSYGASNWHRHLYARLARSMKKLT